MGRKAKQKAREHKTGPIRILPRSAGSLGDAFKRRVLLAELEGFLTKLGRLEKEYTFCPGRRFRFDYAVPELWLAVEVDGGVWIWGRHNRPKTFQADLEKLNLATAMGWRVFRYTYDMLQRRAYEKDIRELVYAAHA